MVSAVFLVLAFKCFKQHDSIVADFEGHVVTGFVVEAAASVCIDDALPVAAVRLLERILDVFGEAVLPQLLHTLRDDVSGGPLHLDRHVTVIELPRRQEHRCRYRAPGTARVGLRRY